jgi:hypothetical protein
LSQYDCSRPFPDEGIVVHGVDGPVGVFGLKRDPAAGPVGERPPK